MEKLNEQRASGKLCDVTIEINRKLILAHRNILAAKSEYFEAAFIGPLAENKNNKMTLYDMDEVAVEALINFIYTDKLDIRTDNVRDLLFAASFLLLDGAVEACTTFLMNSLNTANCLSFLSFAEAQAFPNSKVLLKASQYIYEHFKELSVEKEFLKLHIDDLVKLISDNKVLATEETIYNAVVRWLKHDENRIQYTELLMEKVRFCHMGTKFLSTTVGRESLVKQNKKAKIMLREARKSLKVPTVKPQPRSYGTSVYAVGGFFPDLNTPIAEAAIVERFDVVKNDWSQLSPLSRPKRGTTIAVMDNILYIFGGADRDRPAEIEIYDLLTEKSVVKDTFDVKLPRRDCTGVTVLNGSIYIIGGWDYEAAAVTNVVQRYTPDGNRLEAMAPLHRAMRSMGVGVLNGKIYSCGGRAYYHWQNNGYGPHGKHVLHPITSGNNSGKYVEMYDPTTGQWETLKQSMNHGRFSFSCAALSGFLYAVGGRNGNGATTKCEKFDPKTGAWTVIAPMKYARNAGVVTLGGLMYAVAGEKGHRMERSIVEVYDPIADVWSKREAPGKTHAYRKNRAYVSFSSTF